MVACGTPARGAGEVPSRADIRSRSSIAALRLKVSTRIRSGSVPCSIRRATASTSVVVFPVPGPASTSSGPPVCSATARWYSSSTGGSGCTRGLRTRR